MISNIFFAWFRRSSSWGKKTKATPYSRSPPSAMPDAFVTLAKNLCGICVRIPTPSPVLPSASLPALCSRFSTIFRAFVTVARLFSPLIFTQAPIPQLSCSKDSRYKGAFGTFLFASNIFLSLSSYKDGCCGTCRTLPVPYSSTADYPYPDKKRRSGSTSERSVASLPSYYTTLFRICK